MYTHEWWIVYAEIGGVNMELATIQTIGNAFCHLLIAVGYVSVICCLYRTIKEDRK